MTGAMPTGRGFAATAMNGGGSIRRGEGPAEGVDQQPVDYRCVAAVPLAARYPAGRLSGFSGDRAVSRIVPLGLRTAVTLAWPALPSQTATGPSIVAVSRTGFRHRDEFESGTSHQARSDGQARYARHRSGCHVTPPPVASDRYGAYCHYCSNEQSLLRHGCKAITGQQQGHSSGPR